MSPVGHQFVETRGYTANPLTGNTSLYAPAPLVEIPVAVDTALLAGVGTTGLLFFGVRAQGLTTDARSRVPGVTTVGGGT